MRWGRVALAAVVLLLATGMIRVAVSAKRHWSDPCIAMAGAPALKWNVACELKLVMAVVHVPERVIDSGRYREVAIGMTRPQVIAALRTMGISQVGPDVKREQIVTRASEVPSLREAPRLTIDSGTTVEFSGDRVRSVSTDASDTSRPSELREGMSRDEALVVIARFLGSHPATVVPRPSENWIDLSATDARSRRDLEAFDVWGYGLREPQAISTIRIEFTDGRVARIRESASPVELP